jgi:hypothetical protein
MTGVGQSVVSQLQAVGITRSRAGSRKAQWLQKQVWKRVKQG